MSTKIGVLSVDGTEVTFVTGYPSRDERRYSAATCYGPFSIVPTEEVDSFVAGVTEHLKNTGRWSRVQEVSIENVGLRDATKLKSGQEAINDFCKYLDDERHW